ncbi:uncharacterized protein DSM5745_09201 [Aspergillus mulundensis]|uniref:Uncharacterized protein n=1 Tax=Aspergillus mulundensis TaxID=1810919 RepID=A0A3D8R005_9EURO|nr:Uncharacterized protein DSM5745_09201 [Aspergillus mulundensis]RDW67335.1 Uncharacterized protein DSM5745_09201 [Aspergillus mulundensis]
MLPSAESNSSQSSFDSPISQFPPQQHAWYPVPVPRRRELPKFPRFYSTPLNQDHPDSTPLQIYGLEEREPSIAERPRRFLRFSRALDDIKEDFISQPNPRNTAEAIRARRQSTFSSFFFDNNSNPTLSLSSSSAGPASASASVFHSSGASVASGSISPDSDGASSARPFPPPPPIPEDETDLTRRPTLGRRLSRRLSRLSFSQRRASYRAGGASISQPNLIGSSAQI